MKPQPMSEPTPPLFYERAASGNSHKNWWTRFAGARNCLQVSVTQTEVWIRPSFPFNLLAGVYDLEYRIPSNGLSASLLTHPILGQLVLLDFRCADGRQRRFQLRLSNPQAFLDALKNP